MLPRVSLFQLGGHRNKREPKCLFAPPACCSLFIHTQDEYIPDAESVRQQRALHQQPQSCTLAQCFQLYTKEEQVGGWPGGSPGKLRPSPAAGKPPPKASLRSPAPFSALSGLLREITLNPVLCSQVAGRRTACFLLQSAPLPPQWISSEGPGEAGRVAGRAGATLCLLTWPWLCSACSALLGRRGLQGQGRAPVAPLTASAHASSWPPTMPGAALTASSCSKEASA